MSSSRAARISGFLSVTGKFFGPSASKLGSGSWFSLRKESMTSAFLAIRAARVVSVDRFWAITSASEYRR
jgi:hypothetical protein